MVEKICVICGKEFTTNRGNQITCSKECAFQRKKQTTLKSYKKNYKRRLEESRKRYKEKCSSKKHSTNKKSAKEAMEFHNLRLQRQREARALGLTYAQYIAQKGIREI